MGSGGGDGDGGENDVRNANEDHNISMQCIHRRRKRRKGRRVVRRRGKEESVSRGRV